MKQKKRHSGLRITIWALLGFGIGSMSGRLGIALFTAIVFGFARWLGERLGAPKEQVQPTGVPPLSASMSDHYQTSGLTDSEIQVFRDTMDAAAKQITTIETLIEAVPKLKQVALNHDLVPVLHAYFKAIVDQPKRLPEAANFLYDHLPNLERLMTRYQTITHHEVKSVDTFAVLDQAEQAIGQLADNITNQYQSFVADDIEDLESEIALTQKQIPETSSGKHAAPENNTQEELIAHDGTQQSHQ